MVRMSVNEVPGAGLHLEIRSGRGLPTAFLITSVMNEVNVREISRPKIVTWALWKPGRTIAAYIMKKIRGQTPA